MKPLTVYKASAGSGKTFTLACEYIKLLIDNPYSFRSILAVTFTNKATEEMKLRILSQLYGIWKGLPESRDYLDIITRALGISQQQAAEKAGVALRHLIHHYNYFRVETIDSFFQSVLRNLARELDLTANLRIGLNDRQVEEMAVDHLIESLDKESIVLKWLIGYIFANISDNKSWNVIGAIKKFGENIFRDDYKNNSHQLSALVEKDFFAVYQKRMRQLRDEATKAMADYAQQFERITREAGLEPSSYAGKNRGICSYFNKLKGNKFSDANCINKTLNDCMESAEKWTTKSSAEREVILRLAETRLMDLLRRAENDRKTKWRDYSSANATLRHLNELQLLNRIENKVRDLNNEANRFLLSDTQYLLHGLISESDSPFIFEKVGCHLEHIMIDEFQDTSTVQWMNFKVLLNECMSHATGHNDQLVNNLIVGDVKQSIYRWRSGDWRLLNDIERQFDNPREQVFVTDLSTNYRSERNIIRFNNAFFEAAAKHEHQQELEVNDEATAAELTKAYAKVSQEIPAHRLDKGYVQVNLLPEEDYEAQTLQLMCDTVTSLMQQGAKPQQIAVLIRYNKHIPVIADHFMRYLPGVKIVSDEAFRLDASLAVNIIVLALRLLVHPDDMLNKVRLAVAYQQHVLDNGADEKDIILFRQHDEGYLDGKLPDHFISCHDEILKKPFFDILEDIFNDFSLQRLSDQSAYLYAFYDQVADFLNDTSANIGTFLDLWEEDICSKTIQSDSQDGIRLISIHKSKGLEFDHVIIPFCDWALESRNTTLWCNPKETPFSDMPIVPVDYSKTLLETIYADDYRNEHIQNSVDNLNLLYVAFTRAGKSLFVTGKDTSNAKSVTNRSAVLNNCLDDIMDLLPGASVDKEEDGGMTFTFGTLALEGKKEDKKQSDNVFLKSSDRIEVNPQSFANPTVFRQSNKSREFVKSQDADEEQDNTGYINIGKIMHSIFSRIRTTNDIDKVLAQLETEGVLYGPQLTFKRIRRLLDNILKNKTVARWFDHHWTVYNECNILMWDDKEQRMTERRPDRVITDGQETIVIDFKFGHSQSRYHDQVRAYMALLAQMGHQHIKGYLWYVYNNRIEEVKAVTEQ